ncbi:MAG: hypothetical protein P8J20_14615 [Novosphingobium sp.]|nr:hypothetical protein [Novosphingobium sp.]
MVERYIEIVDGLSERLGVPLLTHEYQIACVLLDLDRLTPKELFPHTRLSSTGFFKILGQMHARGVLYSEVNRHDKRSKIYGLDEDIREAIIRQFEFYRASSLEAFKSLGIENPEVSIQSRHKIHKLRVKHLTCEYQIILYLHLRPGISYSQFVETVGVSETKFNATLRHLVGLGLVYFVRDPVDRRRKLYHISQEVRQAIGDTQERVFRWLDTRQTAQAGE